MVEISSFAGTRRGEFSPRVRFHVINKTRDFSFHVVGSLPLSLSLYSRCARDKIDFMAVALVLANISDTIMQQHRARARAPAHRCLQAVAKTAFRACVTIEP